MKVLSQAESIIQRDLPIIPIYYYTRVYLKKPVLRGFEPELGDTHLFMGVDASTDAGEIWHLYRSKIRRYEGASLVRDVPLLGGDLLCALDVGVVVGPVARRAAAAARWRRGSARRDRRVGACAPLRSLPADGTPRRRDGPRAVGDHAGHRPVPRQDHAGADRRPRPRPRAAGTTSSTAWPSRAGRGPGPAARPTSTRWSPRIWPRSPWRRPPWPRYRLPVPSTPSAGPT